MAGLLICTRRQDVRLLWLLLRLLLLLGFCFLGGHVDVCLW
jgi:hypothetical protein